MTRPGLLDSEYRHRLPVTPTVTLHEGNTPLLRSAHLSEMTGCQVCAAAVAGLLQQHRDGHLAPGQRIVITLSGNGHKDPDASQRVGYDPTRTGAATASVARELGLAA